MPARGRENLNLSLALVWMCWRAASDGRAGSSDRVECVNPHRHNATLQTLNLGNNQIGAVGAAAIGEGLRCVPDRYRTIFLTCCVIARRACAVVDIEKTMGWSIEYLDAHCWHLFVCVVALLRGRENEKRR